MNSIFARANVVSLQIVIPISIWTTFYRPKGFELSQDVEGAAQQFEDSRRQAWLLYFSIPYMVVALTSFASTVNYFDLGIDLIRRLRVMHENTDQLSHRLRGLFNWQCSTLFSVYWSYFFLAVALVLNATTFIFAMGLLYLMLTSDGKPEDSIYPQVIDVIKGTQLRNTGVVCDLYRSGARLPVCVLHARPVYFELFG